MARRKKRQPTISPSQMRSMDCRLQWHWGYRKGYRLARVNEALDLGSGIHEAMDAYYGRGEDLVKTFQKWADKRIAKIDPSWREDIEKLEEIKDLGTSMLEGYLEHYGEDEDFDVLATEKTLRVPILHPKTGEPTPYLMVARLDGIIRDHHTGRLFSLEHKTYSRTVDDKTLEQDHQFTSQVWLGQSLAEQMDLDEEVVGVLYNGLRKAKKTPRTKAALYRRERLFRTPRSIEVLQHRAYWMAKEFYGRRDLPIYPQPDTTKCSMCDFQDPCIAYMRGEDYQILLDANYTKRGEK